MIGNMVLFGASFRRLASAVCLIHLIHTCIVSIKPERGKGIDYVILSAATRLEIDRTPPSLKLVKS